VEGLGRIFAPIGKWWKQASGTQRAAVGLFLVFSAALLIGVAVVASRPSYGVLYSNLQTDDAGAMLTALKELKVPYRLAANGSGIEVPQDRVHELRLQLAGQGLPRGGNVGFEIFDKSQLGLSEFTEKLNYQRALQGELSRTIAELEPVEFARVHVVLPQERLYTSEQQPVTASVVLALKPGAQVSPPQIKSIVHLVSSAVEGLKPDNVTIVDTAGELLSAQVDTSGGPGSPMLASSQLKLQRDFETETARSLQSMLEKVLGPGRAVVRVSAKMSFDHQETEEETYQPAEGSQGGSAGVLAQQEQVQETYAGGKSLPSGIPGVASNTGTATPPARPGGNADNYQRTESKAEYRVSRRVNRTTVQPGQVQRMSVAVFVDGDLQPTQIAQIQESVTAAAGLDASRGDQVIVQGAKFSAAPDQDTKQERQLASRRTLITVGKDAAAVVLLMMFLIFARSAFKTKAGSEPEPTPTQVLPEGRSLAGYAGMAFPGGGPAASPLAELSQAESESLARSIRSWLSEPKVEAER
jgi:flagellar M-ring protein FliF